MPDLPIQPTILVKKTDGTTERITLAELKARQSGQTIATVVPAVVAKVVIPEEVKVLEPKIDQPHGLVIGPVEKRISTSSEMAQDKIIHAPLKTDDVKSLLHEEAPDSPHADGMVAPARVDQVSNIISGLSFKIPSQFENRLRSGIQLRLKDVRGEVDTRDLCLRSIKDGGLGLSQSQTDELISKTQPIASTFVKKDLSSSAPILPLLPVIETMKKTEREAAIEKIVGQTQPVTLIADLITPKKIEANSTANPVRSNPSQSFRPMVHDVQAKPVAMSPLDEIQYFSLIDLRRLSSQPSEAVNRLKQKFVNLKDESYLLFMESWNAWHNSPLYQSYLEVIDESMSQKINLNTALNTKEKISLAEIEALVKMEKELDL